MKAVSIVRDRGQLTIPDSVRKLVSWVTPMSAVSISVIKPDQIIIRPHQNSLDWDRIWESIKRSRAIHGKGRVGGSEFLSKDRQSH